MRRLHGMRKAGQGIGSPAVICCSMLMVLGLAASVAAVPMDYDNLDKGRRIAEEFDTFLRFDGTTGPGNLKTAVYFNDNYIDPVFTYEMTLAPDSGTHFISKIQAGGDIFNLISDFDGQSRIDGFIDAGYSFGSIRDGGFALAPEDAFAILYETSLQTVTWTASSVSAISGGSESFWNNSAPITFFYRSSLAPGTAGYLSINKKTGWASGLAPDPNAPLPAPVPEPATLLLLSTGLIGVADAARRRSRSPGA